MKFISSCLKQTLTPTMVPVITTGTKSLEEVDGTKEALAAEAAEVAEVAVTIAEITKLLTNRLEG